MDITADAFWEPLPSILLIIASSDYIAVDLEMTGVKIKDSVRLDTMTLDQVYGRVRAAASTFQAVQIGFTCLRWTGTSYQSFTFTIPITPMFTTDSKESARMADIIDRKLTLSYSSLLFLKRHNFDLNDALGNGVPYLSREELDDVTNQMLEDKLYERIDPESLGPSGQMFYASLAEELKEWLESGLSEEAVFRVFDPAGGMLRRSTTHMVYQLIREDFPTCRCWKDADSWAMNVKLKDFAAEKKAKTDAMVLIKEAIGKQIGLSWIIEALMGDDKLRSYSDKGYSFPLHEVDHCIASSLEQDISQWTCDAGVHWGEILRKLKKSKPVLIGHNLVYDLCFLYTMFVGQLPDRLEDFAQRIHQLFPRLVDTKVLISQSADADIIDQRLEDVFTNLEIQSYPFIGSVPGWCYNRHTHSHEAKAHNAGFDSYMTATVFLKLATRQMHIQEETWSSGSDTEATKNPPWSPNWLEDPDQWDPYAQSLRSPQCTRLPDFQSGFFAPVRNKLRMSFAGILDLEGQRWPSRPLMPPLFAAPNQASEEDRNILVKLRSQMDKLQILIGSRIGGDEAEGIKDLCVTLGCLRDEIGKRHNH